jgi:hypothetical protein
MRSIKDDPFGRDQYVFCRITIPLAMERRVRQASALSFNPRMTITLVPKAFASRIAMVARFQTNSPVSSMVLTLSFQLILENPRMCR